MSDEKTKPMKVKGLDLKIPFVSMLWLVVKVWLAHLVVLAVLGIVAVSGVAALAIVGVSLSQDVAEEEKEEDGW